MKAVIDQLIKNPDMMREIGFFWVFVIALIAASAYFAPVIKQYLVTKIKSSARIEQVIENCTAAVNNNSEALRNNSEALHANNDERDYLARTRPRFRPAFPRAERCADQNRKQATRKVNL